MGEPLDFEINSWPKPTEAIPEMTAKQFNFVFFVFFYLVRPVTNKSPISSQ